MPLAARWADIFKFASVNDSNSNTGLYDRLTDFVEGTDKIDVRGLSFTSVITSTSATPDASTLGIYYDSTNNRTDVANSQNHFFLYLDGGHTAALHQERPSRP